MSRIVTVDKRQEFSRKLKHYIAGLKSPRSLALCQFPLVLVKLK